MIDGDIIFQNLKKTYADLDESLFWASVNDVAFAKWKQLLFHLMPIPLLKQISEVRK